MGQQGAVWTRIGKDRESRRTLPEGYFLQWKHTVYNRIEVIGMILPGLEPLACHSHTSRLYHDVYPCHPHTSRLYHDLYPCHPHTSRLYHDLYPWPVTLTPHVFTMTFTPVTHTSRLYHKTLQVVARHAVR